MAQHRLAEVAAGLAVLAGAAAFLVYGLATTGRAGPAGTHLSARFENIGALTPGADVRIAGVPVGRVTALEIDPTTFQAIVRFTVKAGIKLPDDSSATVSTSGLLGSPVLSLAPGGGDTTLTDGGVVKITQGATNIEDLLGKFIFNVGSLSDATQKMLRQNGQPDPAAKP